MATPYNDTLTGTVFDDYMDGENGDDVLLGSTGSDILVGNNGNDVLHGFGGNAYEYDELYGGYGADSFYLGNSQYGDYYLGDGYAIIHDIYWQDGDKFIVGSDSSQYSLVTNTNLIGGTALDTAIYKGGDLLAVVKDTTNVIASQDFMVG
ncbi:MAG TPA: hypothetical protein V6C65_33080 [Allocoleopsis sp.]